MSNKPTFLFYDLETGDIDVKTTRISQFSSIRVDSDFNVIEEKNYYCAPMLDYIPSPYANIVTKITAIDILEIQKNNPEKVLNEYELYSMLNKDFNEKGTCTIGFNSLKYDDEIVRRGFYRNLFPIYDREFKNNCSRFDIFPLVKLFANLYKDEFIVPVIEKKRFNELTGQEEVIYSKSYKLENLSKANGFTVENGLYHDALTDVRATIFLAKKMKEINKDFWELAMHLKDKNNLFTYLSVNKNKPFILESSFFGASKSFTSLVYVLSAHPCDKNKFIAIDLTNEQGVKNLLQANTANDLVNHYKTKESGLIEIEINKFPSIVSVNDLEKLKVPQIDYSQYEDIMQQLNSKLVTEIILNKYNNPYSNKPADPTTNPDFNIYSGGFASKTDQFRLEEFHRDLEIGIIGKYLDDCVEFDDPKYAELAKNIIKRNFLDKLNEPEYDVIKEEWGKSNIFIYNNKYVEKYSDKTPVIPFSKTQLIEIVNELVKNSKNDEEKELLEKYKNSINYYFNESKKLYIKNNELEEKPKSTVKKIKI